MILLYTCALVAVTLLPFAIRMSGMALPRRGAGAGRLCSCCYAVQLYRDYSDALARATFSYSILYLAALFAALLVDHYCPLMTASGRVFVALPGARRRAAAGRAATAAEPQVQGHRHHRHRATAATSP